MASPTPNAATDSGLADSIFTFTFTARSGDAWGGWFVADSEAHAAGYLLVTAHGQYAITSERETGLDLTAQGMKDGQVFVEWYRDAGGAFLPTRAGPGAAAGVAGLGSESDAAWNGVAWDGFGAGGADQANAAELPADSLFTWRFTASSGDRWTGVLFELGASFEVGDTVTTAAGSYQILSERGLADGEAAARGTVRLTGSYHDAGSNGALAVQGADGTANAGTGGLGSETGTAWDGEAWVAFGGGGAFQADADCDSSYYWTYWNPTTGDGYGGWMIEDTGRYAAGQVIPFNGGDYVIWTETPLGTHGGFANGTLWMTYYYDGSSGTWLTPHSWANAQSALATRGLGLESDFAWDGDGWDWFGWGDTRWVGVEQDSVYRWSFWSPNTGDAYVGRVVADAGTYSVGQVIRSWDGNYRIEGEERLGRRGEDPWGTVWVDGYYDRGSDAWLTGWTNRDGRVAGTGGIGSESDFAWDGDGWDWFGRGDTRWVGVE